MTYKSITSNDNCTFSEKNVPKIFYQDKFSTKNFQNQMLRVKIWPFILEDAEVFFEQIHQ